MEVPSADTEAPKITWTYDEGETGWTEVCSSGTIQSPIDLTGNRIEQEPEVHEFEIMPKLQPIDTHFEMLQEGRVLALKGNFMNFVTNTLELDNKTN